MSESIDISVYTRHFSCQSGMAWIVLSTRIVPKTRSKASPGWHRSGCGTVYILNDPIDLLCFIGVTYLSPEQLEAEMHNTKDREYQNEELGVVDVSILR